MDPAAGDYHIGPASAALDTGVDCGVTNDIDGDPRPIGAGFEVGADEFYRPILTIAKEVVTGIVYPGYPLTYVLTVENTGTAEATGVVITDTVPAGTVFVSADGGGALVGDAVRWTGLTVPVEGNVEVSFVVRVADGVAPGTAIVNAGYVVGSEQGVGAVGGEVTVWVAAPLAPVGGVSYPEDLPGLGDLAGLGALAAAGVLLTVVLRRRRG